MSVYGRLRQMMSRAADGLMRKETAQTTQESAVHRIQRTVGNSGLARLADQGVLRGPGQALDPGVRQRMESRLGFDFRGVRVHAGADAAAAAKAINARAFTAGQDVVFAPGEYRPHSAAGQQLIAHELTHVAQQAAGGAPAVQRQPAATQADWEKKLDDILPKGVGLIVHIHRTQQLYERFTEAELSELVTLIHANADATKLTKVEAGVPGIFALQDTRVGNRLDVGAARLLLKQFPTQRKTPRKSEETKPEVFPEDIVRQAFIEFHYNALLRGKKDDPLPPDLPDKVRRNCIAIVHDLAPTLFTKDKVVKSLEKGLKKLREKGATFTMPHTGEAFVKAGVSKKRVDIKFKDALGKLTNGNTEPATMTESAWKKVVDLVGNDFGWHIFGMSVMSGHHSVTLFVDNQPGGMTLFWADQWRIDPGDDFQQMAGAVSGFRQYDQKGFDGFIEWLTNDMWNDVHKSDSKCGKRHGSKWDSKCRYTATLSFWHLKRIP